MRLWSIHPMYLNPTRLTACWREGLLARKVLLGQTKGYKNHPQLIRFKETQNPIASIDAYLSVILEEASKRGYSFDHTKINPTHSLENVSMIVTKGQLLYEFEHLKRKLAESHLPQYEELVNAVEILPNPLFKVIEGGIQKWELVK